MGLNDSETEQNVFKGYEAGYTSMHIDLFWLSTLNLQKKCIAELSYIKRKYRLL